ncbi:MAG: TonB family protein [Thermoanaerobaculia bacterium]|nr:MAG: TonB family protein [Thermoanaerobaculia bacterium]
MRYWKTAAITLLLAVPLAVLGHRAAMRRAWVESTPHFRSRPEGQWFVVNEAEMASLDEDRIGRIGFPGTRPRLLRRSELKVPPGHPLARQGGVLVLETVIGPSGNIVQARMLRGLETPELRASLLRCLRAWKFAPAMYRGEPWPVAWTLTLSVRPSDGGASS